MNNLAIPDLIKTIQGPIPAAELFVGFAMAAADFSGSGEADPAVFRNVFEGTFYWFYPGYYGVPDDQVPLLIKILTDPQWEEGQLRTISPRSYLDSNFFSEVPY